MKRLFLLFAAWTLCNATSFGQIMSIDELKTDSIKVNVGITFNLHSNILGEDRIVNISVPDGYEKGIKKYPVLYMVDGQWGHNFTTQTIGWISNPQYGLIPQMIVVSVHTEKTRTHDLTPTKYEQNPTGGGADSLLMFFEKELIPLVDKNYRTFNYRVLSGASFGGLFVMNAFLKTPQLFDGYLCLSPSMWWDNNFMLARTDEYLTNNPELQSKLYLSMANEGVGMGVDSLAAILEKHSLAGLKWKYDKHPDEVHETIGFKGNWDGAKFLLSDWHYPLVDFGAEGEVTSANKEASKISNEVLQSHTGLYIDSYKRILAITASKKNLIVSEDHISNLEIYPEADNKFFAKEYNVEFEFLGEDSLVISSAGEITCTAKQIKCPPFVSLSEKVLGKYTGNFTSPQLDKVNITQKNNLLELSNNQIIAKLYPIGETRFFTFLQGTSYELEFDDEKFIVFVNGNKVAEAERVN